VVILIPEERRGKFPSCRAIAYFVVKKLNDVVKEHLGETS